MKVSELIAMLSEYPSDMNVYGFYNEPLWQNDWVTELKLRKVPVYDDPDFDGGIVQFVYGDPINSYADRVRYEWKDNPSSTIPKPYYALVIDVRGDAERIPTHNKRDELSPDEVDEIIKENE